MIIDGEKYLTTTEAAHRLGTKESRVRQLVLAGRLPARPRLDPRDRLYIPAKAVAAFTRLPRGRKKAVSP